MTTSPVFTIGHSTLSLSEFLALLHLHGVEEVVDVRRYPGSRRYPHFGQALLEHALHADGIRYRHVLALGGRRKAATEGSPNMAWRSLSFRAYADYMATAPFIQALDDLIALSATVRPVIMCAEAVPWRCHRQLIADALVARGLTVLHIIGPARPSEHVLSPHARLLADGRLEYPAEG
jgi:uncharacterized protein (DUF488 family)